MTSRMTDDELIEKFELNTKGHRLKELLYSQRTYNVCLAAATSDGICLRDIPHVYIIQDDVMVSLCVASYGTALYEAPDRFWSNKQLCAMAFNNEDTFHIVKNSAQTNFQHSDFKVIYDNAIEVIPQIKTLVELDVDNKEAAAIVRSLLNNDMKSLDIEPINLDLQYE